MSYRTNPETVLDLVTENEAHKDLYINDEVFDLEIEHLFRNTWVYVGHGSQVPNKGDYFTTTIANQPLIMVRHSDDTIKILENRCAHRGVELVAQTHGNTGRTFSCPYHAWTYKTDGSLIGIPVKEGYNNTGFEKSSAKKGLQTIKNVRVYRDFVFVRLADEGLSFDEFFGESLTSIDNMVDRSPEGRLEVVGDPLRYMNNCNWKMLVENQTDSFHPMIVHYSSAGTVKKIWEEMQPYEGPKPMVVECIVPFTMDYDFYKKMGIRVWQNGHGHTGVNFSIHSDYADTSGYFEKMVKSYGETRAKEILDENRHNTIYFPNIMVKGPIQTLRVFKPIAANRTLVESWIFRLVGAPDMLLERTAMYNRLINAPTSIVGHDDTEVYERAQEGLECNGNSWMNFQRDHFSPEGKSSEEIFDGSTEAQMRNQFRAWKKFMGTTKSGPNGYDAN
ncbi:MAG: Anthranilate 1,2-dioxygenase large subunit [Alphaproteobacteria bacterium MarineAlpha3_Bin7]|nr:MAG: Anthranilate 1,2-dioxygenase large subunit [Alphaproteobacteria bacterium MarineAlpha3_Bin7]